MCFCSLTNLVYQCGNLLYILERLAQCTAMTALVSCLVTMLIIMLGVGIGLGYNYCTVDHQLKLPQLAPKCSGGQSQEEKVDRLKVRRRFAANKNINETTKMLTPSTIAASPETTDYTIQGTKSTTLEVKKLDSLEDLHTVTIYPTMIVPLQKAGLLALIIKLKQRNKNVTLELLES